MKRFTLLLFILCLIPLVSFGGAPLNDKVGEFYQVYLHSSNNTFYQVNTFTFQPNESVAIRGGLYGHITVSASVGATLYGGYQWSDGFHEVSLPWGNPGDHSAPMSQRTLTNPGSTMFPLEIHIERTQWAENIWDIEHSFFELEVVARETGVGID